MLVLGVGGLGWFAMLWWVRCGLAGFRISWGWYNIDFADLAVGWVSWCCRGRGVVQVCGCGWLCGLVWADLCFPVLVVTLVGVYLV